MSVSPGPRHAATSAIGTSHTASPTTIVTSVRRPSASCVGPRGVVRDRDPLVFLQFLDHAHPEPVRRHRAAHQPDRPGHQHDHRERHVHHVDRHERRHRDSHHGPFASAFRPIRIVAEATIAITAGASPANVADDPGDVAVRHVHPRQRQQHEEARQHEQHAGHEPAAHLVQEPAEVDRELLRLRAGQQHAEVQSVQEPAVRDPATALHDLLVHDRDLAGGTAEVDEPELHPEARGFTERHAVLRRLVAHASGV